MRIKRPRFGVLEVRRIVDNKAECTCLVHTGRQVVHLTLAQLQAGANRCPTCAANAAELRKNAIDLTGRVFGDYVAIKSVGLSEHSKTVRHNQEQWRGKSKLQHSYCQHRYWLCYCRTCYTEREIRGDVLRSGNVPKCRGCND